MSRVARSCSCFSPSGWPTSGRPARPRSSPTAGHVPASAALPARPHGQGAFRPGLGRPRRRGDLRVPGPPRGGRHNSPRSRNARLAALRSLFRSTPLRHPEHAQLIQQVLAIPQKRCDKATASFLQPGEVDALLAAPDLTRWEGRRDRALIALAVQTGLRLSELTSLRCGDAQLGAGAHVRCTGKGRKQRCVPLTTATAAIVRAWQRERGGVRDDPLFPTRTGRRLSDDAVEARIAVHKATASQRCPFLAAKKLTPHTLRHTAAMTLLREGIDVAVIALWLGRADIRSTDAYIHADMSIKERALARVTPLSGKPGRYRPPDSLLAFLETL